MKICNIDGCGDHGFAREAGAPDAASARAVARRRFGSPPDRFLQEHSPLLLIGSATEEQK
jgi:hypothetical protein